MPQNDRPVKRNARDRRAARRAEMVEAAMAAVREHGAAVSVAEMAASAGITKPVLYRYFDDRADLQRAVGLRAAEWLMERMAPALAADTGPQHQIAAVIDAFLAGIEEEPELWRFVVHNPAEREPGTEIVEDVREQIARLLAQLIGARLRLAGRDSGAAEAWAHGLVGMVQSAGDWWLERRTMSREDLTGYLTALIWDGAAGILGDAPAESAEASHDDTGDETAPVLHIFPKEAGDGA